MAIAVIMPRQGQSVESCIIAKWHKQKGDSVSVGDMLFTYETDKATFEEEAKADGVLLEIFFEEGDDVECLKNVCVIGESGESVDEFRPDGAEEVTQSANEKEEVAVMTDSVETPAMTQVISQANTGNVHISPRARNLAEKTNADIASAIPTGANNRIMEADIKKVLDAGRFNVAAKPNVANVPVGPDFEEVPLTNVRKFIAKSMRESLVNSAQVTLNSSFDATDVLEFRRKLKNIDAELPNITITDIIVYAVSRVLLKHKPQNAHFLDDKMKLFNNAHIGVAVDTPRGLLVPTIFNANGLSLPDISVTAKDLFEKAKSGNIEPDNLTGASFTISNLGTLGIESFTPVINPPQTGILGVCSIVERTKGGKVYPAMGLSLTFDHRALDGADSGRFLKDLVSYLENFSVMVAMGA